MRLLALAETLDAAAAVAVLVARHLAVSAALAGAATGLARASLAASLLLAAAAVAAYAGLREAATAWPAAALCGRLYAAALLAASAAAAVSTSLVGPEAAAVLLDASWLGASVARLAAYWATGVERLRLLAALALVSGAPGPGPKLVAPVALALLSISLWRVPRRGRGGLPGLGA